MPDKKKKKRTIGRLRGEAETQAKEAAIKAARDRWHRTWEVYSEADDKSPGKKAKTDAFLKAYKQYLKLRPPEPTPAAKPKATPVKKLKPSAASLDLPVTAKRRKRPPADKVKVKRGGLRVTRPQSLKKAIFRKKR